MAKLYEGDENAGPLRVEVIADDSGEWVGNAVRFDEVHEATEYARDLAWRWIAVREWRVISDEGDILDSSNGRG
jgi:hypothetical protein